MVCCDGGYKNTHICVSYSLGYLKYLNKYALTTNVPKCVKYVNKFACQNYLHNIVVLCISISGRCEQICRAKLSYTNSSDMQMYWHITYVETFVVNAYLLKYFIAIFKNRFETLKLVITWCDAFDNFLTDPYNIWDVDVQIWMLDNKIHLMILSGLPICTCLMWSASRRGSLHLIKTFFFGECNYYWKLQ